MNDIFPQKESLTIFWGTNRINIESSQIVSKLNSVQIKSCQNNLYRSLLHEGNMSANSILNLGQKPTLESRTIEIVVVV